MVPADKSAKVTLIMMTRIIEMNDEENEPSDKDRLSCSGTSW